jgi:hypothetical protein
MSLTRYRIGEEPGAPTVTDEMMLLTVVYCLVVGVLLTFAAQRLRQRWMVFWGGGLGIVSLGYLIAAGAGWI